MATTVTYIISEAYKTAGIVSREFQTVTGQQVQDGLFYLNQILSDKTIERDMIPYYTHYTFNAIAGQESYFIPNLEELDTLVFFINNVRYAMRNQTRIPYFGSGRVNNIQSLPFNWHLERGLGGATIFLYFLPNTNYPLEAWGQFRLPSITLNQDLTQFFDDFFINYLLYALANRICVNYNFEIPPSVKEQLLKYEMWISKRSGVLDFTQLKISTLGGGITLNYGQINLGFGWSPS